MIAFTTVTGTAAPLMRPAIDTDQIVPARHLRRVDRAGFGSALFDSWRHGPDGTPNPGFPLNDPRYSGAVFLVTGSNFGCGSSREHAVWALQDYGFRAVVAPSFSDIFRTNALQNGLLPVALPADTVRAIAAIAERRRYVLTVDLARQTVSDDRGLTATFSIDPFRRQCLLMGHDDIDLTLQHEDAIAAFEQSRRNVNHPTGAA